MEMSFFNCLTFITIDWVMFGELLGYQIMRNRYRWLNVFEDLLRFFRSEHVS